MAFILPAFAAIGAAASSILPEAGAAGIAAGTGAEVAAGTIAGASGAAIDLGAISAATPAIAATASTIPAWAGYTSLALQGIGGGIGAIGAIQQAQGQANAQKYNAAVAGINATQATRNAQLAEESGIAQAQTQELKTRAEVGQIRANTAASGLDVNKGSPLDVRSSASELGELNALTVRSNAARAAYGYETQATSFTQEAGLDLAEAKNTEEAGTFGAISSLLGAGAAGGANYVKFLQSGAFTA